MITLKKDDAGTTRSIRLEVEVPGTPEQVWQAIATGPGITAWFAPTEVVEREGGAISFRLGPGMDSTGIVTAWEPHRRFAYEERDWAPGAPPLATEFLVEARGGGTCVVRLVNSLFTSRDDWDDQLKGFESGWPAYLHILGLYLEHFAGRRCLTLRLMGDAPAPEDRAWAALSGALGVSGAALGERRVAPAAVPALAGRVERVTSREILLRTDEPAPGFALGGIYTWNDRVHMLLSLYLFGEQAQAVVAREEPKWRAWMDKLFPSAGVQPTA